MSKRYANRLRFPFLLDFRLQYDKVNRRSRVSDSQLDFPRSQRRPPVAVVGVDLTVMIYIPAHHCYCPNAHFGERHAIFALCSAGFIWACHV
jgi:hypothetical protein